MGAVADSQSSRRLLPLACGIVAAVLAYFLGGFLTFPDPELAHAGRMTLAVTVLTGTCWLSRCLPLAPASLLPLALFPLLGVRSITAVAPAYADPILWLFFGGFVLAMAIERWGLHRRLALHVIAFTGLRPRRLVLGFLLAGLFLSMWISNTATSLMLLPIGMALVDSVKQTGVLDAKMAKRFGIALMLAIAYGCSIGGMATPIGTAPNLLFLRNYQSSVDLDVAPSISFLQWIYHFGPIAILFGLIIWVMLVFVLHRLPKGDRRAGDVIQGELRGLPKFSAAEKRLSCLFALAVMLWLTRREVDLGQLGVFPGWEAWFGYTRGFVADGSVAVLVAIAAFLIPSAGRGSPALMDWETARNLPFPILFLLGGGIAIAAAFSHTGLSQALAQVLAPVMSAVHPMFAVGIIVLLMTFLTEVTSNTATTALMLTVLPGTAVTAGLDPRLLMIPATMAASCAFMLPIATPPNAVVFSSGRVTMGQMARTGLALNLLSVILLTLATWLWLVPGLEIIPDQVPAWWKK